jgi:DNA-binding XRE family transcriptional regulator
MDTNTVPLPMESLADYIKRLRVDLKMSQNDVARAAGIHLHSLGKIERGITHRLNSHTRRGLAIALSIPQEYLEAICNGEIVSTTFSLIKFCPHCWTPGTSPDPIWIDVRSKYCFVCGTKLRSHCESCGKSVTSVKHSYCPYCGFSYKV